MAPKAAAADPSETLAKAVEASKEAATAPAKATALAPLLDLMADATALEAMLGGAADVLAEVGAALVLVSETAADELTTEAVSYTHLTLPTICSV